jgi:hypothetical protein
MATTSVLDQPRVHRVPAAVRAAQALLMGPLGALQFIAAATFVVSLGVHSVRDCVVAAWVLLMAPCCVLVGLRLGRRQPHLLRIALLLLAAQGGFAAVKLFVYHESMSFVFFGLTAACAGLLMLPGSRRHFVS